MPAYKTSESIQQVVALLNQRLYNSGYSFKVYLVESTYVYVKASFDFGYYTNLHMQFNNLVFTNLKENEEWPDAWHDDQIFLLNEQEISDILHFHDVAIPTENQEPIFGIRFNINGKGLDSKGIIIFQTAEIWWEHPYYD